MVPGPGTAWHFHELGYRRFLPALEQVGRREASAPGLRVAPRVRIGVPPLVTMVLDIRFPAWESASLVAGQDEATR